MEVKIKKLHKDAVIPFKTYPSDFCYDVVAVSEEEVVPNVWKYGLGFALQIERGYEVLIKNKVLAMSEQKQKEIEYNTEVDLRKSPINLSIDFRPRSSVYKTGMVLSNCEGTIDENYTGEVSAVFYHVLPSMPRYRKGDKIGQIKIGVTFPINFIEVEELDKRDRGMNGYGSTNQTF